MSRAAYKRVSLLLMADPVFQSNTYNQQASIEMQLIVASKRLGRYGNANSLQDIATRFKIAVGTVELYTSRVISAIIRLKGKFLSWPKARERIAIATRIEGRSGFPACVGFGDGTLVKLEQKPSFNGEDYYSQKQNYGSTVLIVCDDPRKVRYMHTGTQ